ncbi:MAG: thioredoxin family protein [Bacteroidales bacterium]|nr:thioredoxin family protein [Bacteroidales bacterium]MCF8403355.1 thioredoxin family protein [Bacteroidales bacterium]
MFGMSIAGGYQIGDKATDFKLKNIDGKMVSLADYSNAKGFIVIFTCNHCPYAIAYEDRIIELDKKYKKLGYPVIAINPNDPAVQPQDSYDKMKERAEAKRFPFPYLFDEGQKVYPQYGATRTPHVYVLNKAGNELIVEYIGTIDDNYSDESKVKETYLANALDAIIVGNKPDPDFTKAIGCSIKSK